MKRAIVPKKTKTKRRRVNQPQQSAAFKPFGSQSPLAVHHHPFRGGLLDTYDQRTLRVIAGRLRGEKKEDRTEIRGETLLVLKMRFDIVFGRDQTWDGDNAR
ncbi:hypothetical protein GHT06_022050 [Daphnia sinensis]|uniref:Uncharacterized protein n=1 Tax=Daphnia sinensis TaxID=1820382 RepID=A0AAD5PP48_9CRUS|nr:hypothetical protein GHT06_022050 [Daphnia sinensis]